MGCNLNCEPEPTFLLSWLLSECSITEQERSSDTLQHYARRINGNHGSRTMNFDIYFSAQNDVSSVCDSAAIEVRGFLSASSVQPQSPQSGLKCPPYTDSGLEELENKTKGKRGMTLECQRGVLMSPERMSSAHELVQVINFTTHSWVHPLKEIYSSSDFTGPTEYCSYWI